MKKIGWWMTALFALFMLAGSAAPKLVGAEVATAAMSPLGWTSRHLLLIGVVELAGTVLFILPRTAGLGAILLTALFGGAVASHLRVDSPLWSHTLFGLYLGAWMWAALGLRDGSLRQHLLWPKRHH